MVLYMKQESSPKTFEEAMQLMKNMPQKERDVMILENDKVCMCARCPSYIGTGEKMLTFCLKGKSKIIKAEKGCLCPACPVQDKMHFKWVYYCMRGSGAEQSSKK